MDDQTSKEAGLNTMATMAPAAPRHWAIPARADWLAAGALLLVVLATRAMWFGDPVADFDEQIYSLIGWRMTHGDLPFVQVWDRKPFGLFAIFAAAHWLLGPGPLAYQIVASLSAFAAIWGLMRILEKFSAWPFVFYRAFIGVVLIIGVMFGWLS